MTRFEWAPGTDRLVLGGNLALRFLVELAVFASLGYAGASASGSEVVRVLWASVLPLGAIALWTRFLAPKATRRLANPMAILQQSNGVPVADPNSGLFCAFNPGTTDVTITAGGLSYSEVVNVLGGSVEEPCGTVPPTV